MQPLRTARTGFHVRGEIAECARSNHLGQHHGDGLQRFDLIFAVDALRPVLDHQHAEHALGAYDRHTQERAVGILTCFRPIGETLVMGRIGDVERTRGLRDEAHKSLAFLQLGAMHRVRLEPLRREEFMQQPAAQIDRANIGDHRRADHGDEPVEPLLRGAAGLHDLPQFAKENSGAAHMRSRADHRRALPSSLDRFLSTQCRVVTRRRVHRRCAARAPQARYRLHRSAPRF